MRTLFTKEYQEENSYYGLPTNAAVFNDRIKELMTIEYQTDADGNPLLDENGEKIVNPKASYWFDENNQYTIDVMTQEQLDQIMALYNGTETVSQNDEEVMNIIKGETGGLLRRLQDPRRYCSPDPEPRQPVRGRAEVIQDQKAAPALF